MAISTHNCNIMLKALQKRQRTGKSGILLLYLQQIQYFLGTGPDDPNVTSAMYNEAMDKSITIGEDTYLTYVARDHAKTFDKYLNS